MKNILLDIIIIYAYPIDIRVCFNKNASNRGFSLLGLILLVFKFYETGSNVFEKPLTKIKV